MSVEITYDASVSNRPKTKTARFELQLTSEGDRLLVELAGLLVTSKASVVEQGIRLMAAKYGLITLPSPSPEKDPDTTTYPEGGTRGQVIHDPPADYETKKT